MKFTIDWLPVAQAELAQIWLQATDRNDVTAACHRIDQRLSSSPIQAGEARGGTNRVLIDPPLLVFYCVILDDLRVEVYSVRRSSSP